MAEAILVADDEAGIRESLAEILRDAGYAVETAADGAAALEAIDAHDFAVVITDLRMPGADGLAVLRKLRDVAPQTVPLVMTAHGSIESAVEALRGGAADYILKPVVFDDVLAKVARILEHRQLAWQTQMLRREVERDLEDSVLLFRAGCDRGRDRRVGHPGLPELLADCVEVGEELLQLGGELRVSRDPAPRIDGPARVDGDDDRGDHVVDRSLGLVVVAGPGRPVLSLCHRSPPAFQQVPQVVQPALE